MSDKKKIMTSVIAVIVIAGLLVSLGYLAGVARYKTEVKALTFAEVELSQIPDGDYEGSCDVGLIAAKVKVDVKEGQIQHIDLLEHKNGRGEAAEAIIDDIVRRQKIDVDAISGATNSSKVIKKAVENALESAKGGTSE
ncbi:FMN-binding protein [Clostridium aminobutyricum]|uniref:FMN-binding protein n=1 Tax=Clostridium aminobutyricum TaxID=33953 RepID=A0A939IHF2_CLOAM|nr:FMN-binding protein [Clostridium aminobutyricum]MBN7771866.1 FMN-binding protein [Clostridium aminobutyricum]